MSVQISAHSSPPTSLLDSPSTRLYLADRWHNFLPKYSILHIIGNIFERAFQRCIICIILTSNEEPMSVQNLRTQEVQPVTCRPTQPAAFPATRCLLDRPPLRLLGQSPSWSASWKLAGQTHPSHQYCDYQLTVARLIQNPCSHNTDVVTHN